MRLTKEKSEVTQEFGGITPAQKLKRQMAMQIAA